MVCEPVNDRRRDRGVVEHGRPFFEGTVARQDHGSAFVAAGDDLKEQICAKPVDREVAELIDTEKVG